MLARNLELLIKTCKMVFKGKTGKKIAKKLRVAPTPSVDGGEQPFGTKPIKLLLTHHLHNVILAIFTFAVPAKCYATTVLRRTPIPSISTSTTSPAFNAVVVPGVPV